MFKTLQHAVERPTAVLSAFLTLLCPITLDAQQRPEPSFQLWNDHVWAKKRNLPATEIAQLRRLARIPDDDHIDTVVNIDAKSFWKDREVLLATAEGSGQYLGIYLFRQTGSGFKLVWEGREELGIDGFNEAEPSMHCAVSARGTTNGTIIAEDECDDGGIIGTYKWNGKNYAYQGFHTTNAPRSKKK